MPPLTVGPAQRRMATVRLMIQLYCKGNRSGTPLCESCTRLLQYAYLQIEICPHTLTVD